jgi:hypothetical protein
MNAPFHGPTSADVPDDRPNAFETLDGDLVLYDRSMDDAWLQSSVSVPFGVDLAESSPSG